MLHCTYSRLNEVDQSINHCVRLDGVGGRQLDGLVRGRGGGGGGEMGV